MALTPGSEYTVLLTNTLTPLILDDSNYYAYDFGLYCLNASATTSFSICNLMPYPIVLDNFVDGSGGEFIFPSLTGLTIDAYGTYIFDVSFTPSIIGTTYALWGLYSGGTLMVELHFSGTSSNSLLTFTNSSCFLNFGNVGLTNSITTNKEITNDTDRDIIITFSGDMTNYSVNTPTTLTPGINYIPFTFNPHNIETCNETFILQGDCSDHVINLCGFGTMSDSVYLTMDGGYTYVGCCVPLTLHIYNNHLNYTNDSITVTNITTDGIITTNTTFPFVIDPFTCAILDYTFCPLVSGYTSENITVEYTYEDYGTIFTGTSEININLSAYTHPFSTLNVDCINFTCRNVNTGQTFNITNYSAEPFEFYYLIEPKDGYDINNIFQTDITPPITLPGYTTTGITINFDANYLTTGQTFGDLFHLKLIDPNCCREYDKCINVRFCPTTLIVDFGYPKNVSCYGGCDGAYSFIITDCSGEYHIAWSSETEQPIYEEILHCAIGPEEDDCYFVADENGWQYYDKVSASNLLAGNYLVTITNACNETTYHGFSITEPDPLFVSIDWKNPNNYCKSDIGQLCGIVPTPDVNPSGYVVIDKETLVKVINNDMHNIPGQTKRGYQQYDARENQIAEGQKIDGINSFRNYILDFFVGNFIKYKHKWEKEEKITVQAWDDIVADTIGQGCCFASYVSGGTAPYTYQWYGPNGYTAISPNIFNRPCCEPYILMVTDYNGCTYSATSTCLQCSFGITELQQTNPTCIDSEDGEVYVEISGNCPDAVYKIELESSSWIDVYTADTHTFIQLGRGDYILRVENIETECKLDPINITLIPKYEFTIGANITGATCTQYCDGIVEIIVDVINNEDNIDPTFLYYLDGETTYLNSNIFTNLCAGEHTIKVINTINDCEKTEIITVPNLSLFQVQTSVKPSSGIDINDGEITITVQNGSSLCPDCECYILESTDGQLELPQKDFYTEEGCIVGGEEGDCIIMVETIDLENINYICNGLSVFTNGSYTITNLLPGYYYFSLTDNHGCIVNFKAVVGYIKQRQDKKEMFNTKRSDSYSGSKITSNTPKRQ